MSFISFEFIFFFAIVFILYFMLPQRYRLIVLLVASYLFYMRWEASYLFLLLGTTLFNYVMGLRLEAEERLVYRRALLGVCVVANLMTLAVFKYFNFFLDSIHNLLGAFGVTYSSPSLDLLVPLGISFYTLQVLSYVFDIYQRRTQPTRNLGNFALFVSFFPQIVAGPIARADKLLPQFSRKISFDYDRVVGGLQRMSWGFFKKLVIADRLALMTNTVYADPTQFTGMPLIVATYAFAIQIYCDFSAYSDIAIGAARVLGFDLMENFDRPYFATSILDFWRRWHISLSTWLRDYIFFPSSRSMLRRYGSHHGLLIQGIAYMLTMLVSGIWHGSDWTFVVWGGIHGLLMAVTVLWQRVTRPIKWMSYMPPMIVHSLQVFITFHLVTLTWIFFRANSLADAAYVVSHLFANFEFKPLLNVIMPGGAYEFGIAVIAIVVMVFVEFLQRADRDSTATRARFPAALRWSFYYIVILAIVMFGQFGQTEFIYAQF